MSDYEPGTLPERNPVTHATHRREVFRQITIPLLVGILVVLGLCVLTVWGGVQGPQGVGKWADISLIWLILPALFATLVFTLLVGGIAYGIIWAVNKLPTAFRKLQDLVNTFGALVRRLTDLLVEPVMRVQGFRASLRALRRR